jgi:hypothetical protein
MTTLAEASVLIPRMGRRRALSRPWSHSTWLLAYCSVHVPPYPGHLDVGLVDEPSAARRVAARAGCVDQQWGEALHPSEQGDVVDLDASLGQQFLKIAI